MKRCSKCGLEKEDEEFNWKIKPFKRHSICKTCSNEYRREWYEGHSDQVKVSAKKHTEEAREAARHYVFQYLQTHPCVDCGNADPYVLTFDHVSGNKRKHISTMVREGFSLETIQEEIDKCEVRCANCHMRKHKKLRGTNYWLF